MPPRSGLRTWIQIRTIIMVTSRIASGKTLDVHYFCFKSADKYLVSLPMWNFSIPYKLKQYIDLLVHRGLTFSFTPEGGYKGLVTGKPLVAVYARGGA